MCLHVVYAHVLHLVCHGIMVFCADEFAPTS
jgi:hypothetical protein